MIASNHKVFTIVQTPPPTNTGHISGYVYEDTNSNWIKDTWEKTMAWWKVCIDTNNNGTSETFNVTNNQWYFEFNGLQTGSYKILEIPHQNWTIFSPSIWYYQVTLTNWQQVNNKNFWNKNTKKK